ncbi:MAG: DUF1015 family protein [Actinomycetaceae bacterium]|nr:DUF1015 family protein [Actinomycetaceae bacterium]
MSTVRPFRAIRPLPSLSQRMACLPYDVMSRAEAAQMAVDNPYSFLRVIRADAFLPDDIDEHDPRVYRAGAEQLHSFISEGALQFDTNDSLYIYRQIMDGHTQTGVVGCVSVDEYNNGEIKRHELTLKAKEEDRICHFDACDTSTEPIFLTYRAHEKIDKIIEQWTTTYEPDDDVELSDALQVRHQLWRIDDPDTIACLRRAFQQVDSLYIADGHHRSASTAAVCEKRKASAGTTPGDDPEYHYMMAVIFADHNLKIMDYNRIISDLNSLTPSDFISMIKEAGFEVSSAITDPSTRVFAPKKPHSFGMYLDGKWYEVLAHLDDKNMTTQERLDVSILQNKILTPLLRVGDPRTDSRIRCVGGVRGLQYLADEVDRQGDGVAFSMYPVSINEIMAIADEGKIMPPKSTWFEPKLVSGLFLHALYDPRTCQT